MKPHFDPNNTIIRLCMQAMALKDGQRTAEARTLFLQAWEQASNPLERFIAAFFTAREEGDAAARLNWLEKALEQALLQDDPGSRSALPALYTAMAECHEAMGNRPQADAASQQARAHSFLPSDPGPFYHGTKADLQIGDLLTPGGVSNYQQDLVMNHIYFTALLSGAGLAASLAQGEGPQRIYRVEPTGPYEHDPNVTDKKFPGNLTRSYRSTFPLRIVGEETDWNRQSEEDVQRWREKLANNKGAIIN